MRCHSLVPLSLPFWFAFATVFAVGPSAGATPRKLSLSRAIEMGLTKNPRIQLAKEKVGQAEARRRSARGHFGPTASVGASLFFWDDELLFDLPPPSAEVMQKHAAVFAKYADFMAALPDLFSFGAIRDQITSQVTLKLVQPITPLYTVTQGYRIAGLASDAARLDLTATRDGTIFNVTKAYIGLQQVSGAVEIAAGAVKQVAAHLKQAHAFHRAGLIGHNEVLKAELALARAKERVIKVSAAQSMTQSALALALGLSPKEVIDPTETFPDPPPPLKLDLESSVQLAMRQRPELRAMDKRVSMADKGKEIARWALIPQVVAMATYQHSEGMGTFVPKDAFFAGGALTWDFWDWGVKYYKIDEAAHKARQARLGARQLRDGIYLDVKKSFLDLQTAAQTLSMARTAISQAKESFRIEKLKFDKNTSTSTDVLDTQLALTRAQLTYNTALYQWYVARAALTKASGGWTRTNNHGFTPGRPQ